MPTKTNEKIIKNNTTQSPEFIEVIDPITILETIDAFCMQLKKKPNNKTIDQINQKLKSWEVITIEHEGHNKWITNQLTLQTIEIKRNLIKRITHLIRTGGEWQCDIIIRNTIEINHLIDIPYSLSVNRDVNPLLAKLIHIHNVLQNILIQGAQNLGVFEKPNGIINMNRLFVWFNTHEVNNQWAVKDTLAVKSLYQLINNITVVTD